MTTFSEQPRVAVLGDAVADVIALGLAALPMWGEDRRVSGVTVALGGSGVHTAVALATLGTPADPYAAVGRDLFGGLLRQGLMKTAVNPATLIELPEAPTAVTLVLSGASDRAFVSLYGATAALTPADLPLAAFDAASHIHVAGLWQSDGLRPHLPGLLARWRGNGTTVSLDTGYDPTGEWSDTIGEILAQVDIFFPNETEALGISRAPNEMAALEALAAQVPLVVMKLGAEGAIAQRGSERWSHPAFPVTVVDTTGAGDSFNAGFLHRWLQGAPIPACLELATATGALAVARPGASESAPDEATALAFIAAATRSV